MEKRQRDNEARRQTIAAPIQAELAKVEMGLQSLAESNSSQGEKKKRPFTDMFKDPGKQREKLLEQKRDLEKKLQAAEIGLEDDARELDSAKLELEKAEEVLTALEKDLASADEAVLAAERACSASQAELENLQNALTALATIWQKYDTLSKGVRSAAPAGK